jgi:hypothetical protein
MANWTFLTPHARVLLCVAHDPPDGRERTIREILDLLTGTDTDRDLIRRQRNRWRRLRLIGSGDGPISGGPISALVWQGLTGA